MKRTAQRTALLLGLLLFAIVWTVLMGLGVAANSLTDDSAGSVSADQFGAGAHVMYVDESAFPTVTLYLAVNDPSGQPVLNLAQDQFVLREDGTAVDITDFVAAGSGTSASMLVIDQSGSMGDEGKLSGAIQAAQTYINLLQVGADQLGVIVFSDGPMTLAPLAVVSEEGRTLLNGLLGLLFPLNGTEFYAATREAIRSLDDIGGRKVVLALTDGMDNNGQSGLGSTVADANAASVPIYTIGLGNSIDREGLEELARRTGGQAYFSPSASELANLYTQIASGLRNEYALTYTSLTPSLDGTQRALAVEIGAAGGAMQTEGGYAVGGILASALNLAIFVPTLALLAIGLVGLYLLPGWRRHKTVTDNDRHLESAESRSDYITYEPAPAVAAGASEPSGPSRPLPVTTQSANLPANPPAPVSAPVVAAPVHSTAVAGQIGLVIEYPLTADVTMIGSAADCHILIDAPTVAPKQAQIRLTAGRYVIEDVTAQGAVRVSYAGDPQKLRGVQQNALRDGSLVEVGGVASVFRQSGDGAQLERHLRLSADGESIGTTQQCTVRLPGGESLAVRISFGERHWFVERLSGACQVSYSGDPNQMRPLHDRNALKIGSRLQVGATLLRLEA
jgi:VWFA-related protein